MPSPNEHYVMGREPDHFEYPMVTTIHAIVMKFMPDRKIHAIKTLRDIANVGLRDAKYQVEYWADGGSPCWMSTDMKDQFRAAVRTDYNRVREVIKHYKREVNYGRS
jgi:hypothetical protein